MKNSTRTCHWIVGVAAALVTSAAGGATFGSPAVPIGDSDIGISARDSAVVAPPTTLIRLMPTDRPELHLSEIAFFVQDQEQQHQFLLPNDSLPAYDFRVPDNARGKLRLSVVGMDNNKKQTELQGVTVVIDPKAYCHAHVSASTGTAATLGVTEGITAAYVFADGLFVGRAQGENQALTLSLDKLPPGDTLLSVISEDAHGLLYAPCQMPIKINPRFKLALSKTDVNVTNPNDSVTLTAAAPPDLGIAKIRFLFAGVPIGTVDGAAATKTFSLADTASGAQVFGVQGITNKGDILGLETLTVNVTNPAADRRLAAMTLQDRLTDDRLQVRQLDNQLDSTVNTLVQTSMGSWNDGWGGWGYGYWGTGPTLNSFKNRRGLYTIPIIDSYSGVGKAGTLLLDVRSLILRRADLELNIAQIQIAQKKAEEAKRTLQEVQDQAYGTWVERRATAMLRTVG